LTNFWAAYLIRRASTLPTKRPWGEGLLKARPSAKDGEIGEGRYQYEGENAKPKKNG
jgi:hypothetical protein